MYISPIKLNNFHNTNFTSKVVRVIQGEASEELKKKVDIFERTQGKKDELLGTGTQAIAYRLSGTDVVIKAARHPMPQTGDGYFKQEADSLLRIPTSLKNCQKLVANLETELGYYYLLSTFVKGKIPDGKEVKWTRESLKSLLESLAELDCKKTYHGDVSKCNCLIEENGTVNLLDFQYQENFEIDGDENHKINAKKYKVPYFCAPSNAQMFEESTFGTYLNDLDQKEAKELFKAYLEEKSNYHAKRAEEFEKQGARSEIVEYETLLAKYLKNPSEDVYKLEAMKLQVLLSHRQVLTSEDTGKQEDLYNILSTIPYYLETIKASNKMIQYSQDLMSVEDDPEKRKLFEYENSYAYFWRGAMKNELDGRHGEFSAYSWILRNAARRPLNEDDNILATFINTAKLPYKEIPNTLDKLTVDYETFGFNDQNENDLTQGIRGIVQNLKNSQKYFVAKNSPQNSIIKEVHENKQQIMNNLKIANEYCLQNNKNIALFYSLKALNELSNTKEFMQEKINDKELETSLKNQIYADINHLSSIGYDIEGFCNELYRQAFREASCDSEVFAV